MAQIPARDQRPTAPERRRRRGSGRFAFVQAGLGRRAWTRETILETFEWWRVEFGHPLARNDWAPSRARAACSAQVAADRGQISVLSRPGGGERTAFAAKYIAAAAMLSLTWVRLDRNG